MDTTDHFDITDRSSDAYVDKDTVELATVSPENAFGGLAKNYRDSE